MATETRSEREELYDITSVAATVDDIKFEYDADKDVKTMEFYKQGKLLFTLEFYYDADKDVIEIKRV